MQVFTESLMRSQSGPLLLLCQNLGSVERQEIFQPNTDTTPENIKGERRVWLVLGRVEAGHQMAEINMRSVSVGDSVIQLYFRKSK